MLVREEAQSQGYAEGVEEIWKKRNSKASCKHWKKEGEGEGPRMHCGLPLGFGVCYHHHCICN